MPLFMLQKIEKICITRVKWAILLLDKSFDSRKPEIRTIQLYISGSYQRRFFPIDTENFTPSFLEKILWGGEPPRL